MRAEFRIWHDKGDFYHIMFDQGTLQRYRVDEFPIASELINRMMKSLLPLLKTQEVLHKKLFQIDYLSTLSNKIIVSLLYHKQLTEEWQNAAENLKGELQQLGFDVQLIGRASKQKICLEQDFVDEVLPVKGRNYVYRQVENSFTQPNAAVNCKMLEWAIDCTQGSQGIYWSCTVVTAISLSPLRKTSVKCLLPKSPSHPWLLHNLILQKTK